MDKYKVKLTRPYSTNTVRVEVYLDHALVGVDEVGDRNHSVFDEDYVDKIRPLIKGVVEDIVTRNEKMMKEMEMIKSLEKEFNESDTTTVGNP